ncbi:hypothetical protein MASR1M36_22370 [Candidatus Cloacimonadaceae bacterium]
MKQYIVILMLLCCALLGATSLQQYRTNGNVLTARLQQLQLAPVPNAEPNLDEGDVQPSLPVITRTFAFPYANAEINLIGMLWNVYDRQGNFLYSENTRDTEAVTLVHGFTFREMQGWTVKISTQKEAGEQIKTLAEINFELLGSQPVAIPNGLSPAFIEAYKALADNFDYSYLRTLPLNRPKMLIISHSQLAAYQTEYLKWKRSQGYDVYVLNRSDLGSSLQDIKAAILAHYQQYQCDYLFLWGDVNGTFAIPTNFYPSPEYAENDADDNYFATLDGEDYFPEMVVGRFSFADASEFITMTNKTMSYEKTPSMTDTNWMKKALVVAGNYAEGGLRPTTPVYMSRWLRDKMLGHGYTQVDSVFYPPSYPGTSSILQAINQGVQFISYRGWGDANGWHYPSFHIPDLNSTFNGAKMPIVFSIVCNTGDFANSVNPSFGEKWMRMGTMSTPGGCIAFVGPSDLHTKTRLNNSISSGAFRSILDQGVRGFGTSVLLGKIELYKNFPNDIAAGQYVPFYYHVYNILSDPSLNMWVLTPNTIPSSVIQGGLEYAQSDSHIRIEAANLDGAMVSGTKNGTDYLYATVQNGYAILPLDPEQSGNLTITITKPNFVPLVAQLSPSEDATLGIVDNSLNEAYINPASNYELNLQVKNFSTAAFSNTALTLSCSHPAVSITQNTQNMASLAAGATANLSFAFSTSGAIYPGEILDFIITTTNPATTKVFQLKAGGAKIIVYNHTGTFALGQANNISFTVCNAGNVDMNNINIHVQSLSTAASAQSAPINIGNLAAGEEKQFNASITLASDTWEGRNLPFRFDATNESGYSYFCFYSATAGNPGTNDPTGPCEYGYYAYDSTDTAYEQAPVYNWIELDPEGGTPLGDVFLTKDDGTRTVNLPFNFRFYGRDYNSVSICSNGWLSFVPTDMVDFYNCYIPAALGPYAMIAGYWDDLKGMKTGVDNEGNGIFNDIRMIYWHDTANNRYIVEWNKAYNQYTIDLMENASLEKFQIILYPRNGQDGDIVIQYHTVDNPGTTTNYSTVGIEDHTQLRGLTFTHGNTYPATAPLLSAGLAVKFTTTAPDSYVANQDLVSPHPVSNLRNYPNPFNPSTTIAFNAAKPGKAKLEIYNLKGQLVKTLVNGYLSAGDNRLEWNGTDNQGNAVSSGLFFYRLEMNGYKKTQKMLMMK